MGELIIQYHDFENAKDEIKKFSEQTTTDLDLKRVDDSKGVGEFFGDWFWGRGIGLNHQVTGEELNELTSQIQTHLHSVNNTQIKLIKEFGQVYSALEALDKDYIQAILVSIKATEETSEGIRKTQEQIKKIVENQRKTLEELKKFKQKLDSYTHLGDIDKIWSDCQKRHQDIVSLTKEISAAAEYNKDNFKSIEALKIALASTKKKTEDMSTHISQMIDRLESVTAFTNSVKKYTHLQDVDEMWKSLTTTQSSLKKIGSNIEVLQKDVVKHQEEINKIFDYVEEVSSLEHLMDVDKLWFYVEEQKLCLKDIEHVNDEHTDQLQFLSRENENLSIHVSQMIEMLESVTAYTSDLEKIMHLQDVDEMWESLTTVQCSLKNIGSTIEELQKDAVKHQEEINKILDYVEKVSSLEHLMDVDKLWSCAEEQNIHLKDIERVNDEQAGQLQLLSRENDKIADRVSTNENYINNLNESINKINDMVHLEDVDSTWDTVKIHSGKLTDIEKQNENIENSVRKNKEDVEAKIVEANNAIASLTQKMKCACLIAGGAACLAIIEMILLLV